MKPWELRGLSLEERLFAQVDRGGPDECWPWTSTPHHTGYGHIRLPHGGPKAQAHRVAYELLIGPIPEGLTLDHLCMNKLCVNPAHLEPVTAEENSSRYWRSRNHCKYGHPFEGENLKVVEGFRACHTCHRRVNAEYRARVRALKREIGAKRGASFRAVREAVR